jgi:5'-nucleotidase/UDP-sugar diphosphatase
MKRLTLVAAMSASAIAMSTGASFADYSLNILHINDWHSRIESNNKFESTCSEEDESKGACFGGAARLLTAIAERRKALEGQNVLLLNAGDNFQGSLFYSTYKGSVETDFLNQMKFDAMALGNHEFDDGEDVLVPFIDKAQFPILGVNIKPNNQSKANGKIKPSVVLDVGGQKIGIVGAVTTDTPEIASPGPNIQFEDDVANITAEVKKLEGEGVNKIIALTHVGYPRDMEAIARIPGVDVVVGGHSHTLLSNKPDDKGAGPYPTMIDNPGGYKVPVVQAASYSKVLGDVVVTFDDAGVVKGAKGDPIWLDKSITPDAAALAKIKELGAPIQEAMKKEVGDTTAAIDGDRKSCRAVECSMGNLIADAMLDRVKGQGVTIAIQNGGGIRASIDQGKVTMGEVFTVLPFQNTLATFQLTGKDLRASIEAGLSEIEEGKGKFPQVAGLKYSFDKAVKPNEGRLKSIETMEGDKWVPLDDAKTYSIVTNNFVRGGGDGYKLFASNATNAYDFGPSLEQVVAAYITANSPYTPKVGDRITDLTSAEVQKQLDEAAAAKKKAAEEKAAAEKAAAEAAAKAPTAPAAPAAAPAAPAAAAPAAPVVAPALPAGSSDIANQAPKIEAAPATPAPAAPAATAPAQAATPAAAPAKADYIIRKGDTYWWLAKRLLGAHQRWPELQAANPSYDPADLPVGEPLKVPG